MLLALRVISHRKLSVFCCFLNNASQKSPLLSLRSQLLETGLLLGDEIEK